MALFLMIFGIAIFALFLAGGYALASLIVSPDTLNAFTGNGPFKLSMFLQTPTAESAGRFVSCILIMGIIGLMVGFTFFMLGKIYKRMDNVERISRRAIRKITRAQE